MNKKRVSVILAMCVLILGFTIGGIVVVAGSSPQESISLDQHSQSKEKQYSNYIANKVMSEIKKIDQVVDCKIEIKNEKTPMMTANVKVITQENKSDVLECDIKEYISESLGISMENITVAFE